MIEFQWPLVLYCLPLPILLRFLLPRANSASDAALKVPYLNDFEFGVAGNKRSGTRFFAMFIYLLAWSCLVAAAARPQWTGDAIELPVSGRDLMLAIDLSESMQQSFTYNFRSVTKLDATKAVASNFIDKRVGDRIGLILFGEQAYVQAPLTFDRATVKTLLQEAVTGLAGQATAIGDAIGLAVKRLENTGSDDRVLILLTDGVSNAGEISPERAAELAARKHLKIHTIGIGPRGSRDLNENTLRDVAKITGGQYFRAHDVQELQQIYQTIDKLEPVERDTRSYRPTWSLFYWPLGAALALASVLGLMRQRGWA